MSSRKSLRSQKGQIAIFLVLVFQVLFVFFAMSINVALVVYDKVNLQNATDVAAYYAAQKQAELLNQIGHVNYQIRQAYKLLAFRVRVIGSMSIGVGGSALPSGSPVRPHPIFTGPGNEGQAFHPPLGAGIFAPGVCVGSTLWREYQKIESNRTTALCRTLEGFTAPPAPGGGGGPLGGFIGSLNDFINEVRGSYENLCKTVSVLDWQLAATMLHAYKLDAIKRAEMIDKIAQNMSKPGNEMLDFRGESVYAGVQNTLKKNLTDAQAETLQFTLTNSLSSDVGGQCANPTFWLPRVDITPVATYVRMIWSNSGFCRNTVVPSRGNLPPDDYIALVGGKNNDMLRASWLDPNPVPVGVEKNPWCIPYMGIKATTRPRKIFAPFGAPVELRAEAYAKPFGGRVGPWYYTTWPQGSPNSEGVSRTDPLLPNRVTAGAPGVGKPADDLVNYSKYPGDVNGLNSQYALGTMSKFVRDNLLGAASLSSLPAILSLQHYNHVGDPAEFERDGDSLVKQNTSDINVQPIQLMEQAAISPDLFDITYYSVDTQYHPNYFNPNNRDFQSFLMGGEYYVDLGSFSRQPFSIFQEIINTNSVYEGVDPFYMVDNPNQVLTSWTQNKATDYRFPDDTFGECLKRHDDKVMDYPSPNGCPHGGRAGASVKIVSKKYLKSINAELGGSGISGNILNPPPEE